MRRLMINVGTIVKGLLTQFMNPPLFREKVADTAGAGFAMNTKEGSLIMEPNVRHVDSQTQEEVMVVPMYWGSIRVHASGRITYAAYGPCGPAIKEDALIESITPDALERIDSAIREMKAVPHSSANNDSPPMSRYTANVLKRTRDGINALKGEAD